MLSQEKHIEYWKKHSSVHRTLQPQKDGDLTSSTGRFYPLHNPPLPQTSDLWHLLLWILWKDTSSSKTYNLAWYVHYTANAFLKLAQTSDVFGDFKGLNGTVNSQEEVTGTTPTWFDMVLVYIPPNERQNEIRTTTQAKVCRVSLRAVSTSDSRVAVTVHAQVRERYAHTKTLHTIFTQRSVIKIFNKQIHIALTMNCFCASFVSYITIMQITLIR